MGSDRLGHNAINSFIWKFLERTIAGFVTIVVSVILGRILTPQDYSLVGIITVFFSIANIFISGGLNTALVQKKDADVEDYSTVLIVNVSLSLVLYAVLFLTAPMIASVYRIDQLVLLIRVMALTLIINAVKSVVCAYISNRLEFRKFFMATIVGTLISAGVGICMALNGCGAWALVAQQMVNAFVDTVILLMVTRIHFEIRLSVNRMKRLLGFGYKMFLSSMINEVYENVSPLIIGIKYQVTDLAYYSKGQLYPKYVNSVISDTFSAVLFPVMAKLQDDRKRLLYYTRSFIKTGAYFLFPMMIGFMAISDSFIQVVLTDKWLPASLYMKFFCVGYMFDILTRGNLQAVKALGRSDVHLILNIIKKIAYTIVIVLFLFLTDSPDKFAVAVIVNSLIAVIINAIPNIRLLGYSIQMQFSDMLPPLAMAVMMGIPVYLLNSLKIAMGLRMVLQIAVGFILYLGISLIFKPFGYEFCKKMIGDLLSRCNKNEHSEKQ